MHDNCKRCVHREEYIPKIQTETITPVRHLCVASPHEEDDTHGLLTWLDVKEFVSDKCMYFKPKVNKMKGPDVKRLVTRLSDLTNSSVFKMSDGSVMMKLRNPELRPSQDVNSAPTWAVDIGNGQIKTDVWQGEHVEFLGLASDLLYA